MQHRFALFAPALLLLAACRYGKPVGPAPTRPSPAAHGAVIPDGVPLADYDYLRERHLRIPVAGVALARIPDSFDDARDGERRHHAVDILAPKGTRVLAEGDRVTKGDTIGFVGRPPRFIASTWCLTRPKPADESTNAGQKIGTSCSYAV